MKTLQDLLGHSSIVITADTYTSVLPDAQRRYADATLVLAAARQTRKRIKQKAAKNRPDGRRKNKHLPANTQAKMWSVARHRWFAVVRDQPAVRLRVRKQAELRTSARVARCLPLS